MGFLDDVRKAAEQVKQEDNAGKIETGLEAPTEQARVALLRGQRFFQVILPIENVDRSALAQTMHDMHASSVKVTATDDLVGPVLTAIEDVGWELISSGITFRPTAAVSRDKFLASGQQIAVIGQTVGVYLFRRQE